MSNNFQLLEFEFEAHAETDESEPDNLAPGMTVESHVRELNTLSDKVARQIQQEIRRALPPRVRVEVDIQFYEGSIAAIGSVILLFLQPIIVEAGKKALEKSFEEGFTRIIQFAIRRILSRHFNQRGISLNGPLEVDVEPPDEGIPERQTNASSTSPSTGTNAAGNFAYLVPLTAANTVLLLVLMIIVIARGVAPLP